MKRIMIISAVALGIFSNGYSQSKKIVDLDAIDEWTYVSRLAAISPDGKYAAYVKENSPQGMQTLNIVSTEGSWRKTFISKDSHFGNGKFSPGNKAYIFQTGGDSLGILTTGADKTAFIPGVRSFEVMENSGNYIYYEKIAGTDKSAIYDLSTNQTIFQTNCVSHLISPDGKTFLYTTKDTVAGKQAVKVWLYDLAGQAAQQVWEGDAAEGFVFDVMGQHIAFLGKKKEGNSKSLLYFSVRTKTLENLLSPATPAGLSGHYDFSSLMGFTKDGSLLYYKIRNIDKEPIPSEKKARVDIWNYNDPMLQEEWIYRKIEPNKEYLMVADVGNMQPRLLCEGDGLPLNWDPSNTDFSSSKFLFRKAGGGEVNEYYWNKTADDSLFLIDVAANTRRLIDKDLSYLMIASTYRISPDGQYILYFDKDTKNYFSYHIADGKRVNLTNGIKEQWCKRITQVQPIQYPRPFGIFGWIRNKNTVLLLQGEYDIWLVYLDGGQSPVCITRHYGKDQQITFGSFFKRSDDKRLYNEKQKIYVSAFDPVTKRNGFYAIYADGKKAPEKLTMDDYAYIVPGTVHSWGEIEPVKAAGADAWLVARQSATESVNYFFTKDFKNFKPITHNYPEKEYNWVKTELINWTLPNGHNSRGVLYKPDNFDPTKKYPLIFLYYEELSNDLNVYIKPMRAVDDINIPYYVSNGYLVFTPDIERTSDGAGVDALHTMESAAGYLSKFSYVDPKRLGLCGTSMGGYKTNFIITHSQLFAAANTISGPSSIASFGLSTWGNAMAISLVEAGQFCIGHSIIERPDLYVTNSPIFYVNKVQTPLLMLYGAEDPTNYVDGVALFQALRRSGKRAWMLNYDGQGHFLDSRDTIITTDYTIRQKQFFDHYLMGKPAPVWMTRGVPNWRKRIDDGLELDSTIQTPPVGGILTPKEKALYEGKHVPVAVTLEKMEK